MELDKLATKDNKFFFFLRNINIFKKETNDIPVLVETNLQKEKREINDKIMKFIDTNNTEMLNIFITEDVKLNKLHLKAILNKLGSFTFELDYEFKKKFFSTNSENINEIVVDALEESIEFFSNPKPNNDNFRRENEKKLNELNPIYMFLHLWAKMTLEKNKEKTLEIFELTQELATKCDKIPGSAHYTKNLIKDALNSLNPLYITAAKQDLVKLAKRAKSLEFSDIKTVMLSDMAQDINNFDIKNLPLNAQSLFTQIQDICVELKDHKESMNTQQSLHFENLQLKRLPQTIKEYISIPGKYLEQLNQHEVSPDHLLVDSLTQIKSGLISLTQSIQEQGVQNMKKTNNYLKSL